MWEMEFVMTQIIIIFAPLMEEIAAFKTQIGVIYKLQLKSEKKAPLLNKPYENEVTLRRQKPPLKCC